MRQIIAMGGGGFSMEPDNPALDQYLIEQCQDPWPKVCFLATASGDAETYRLRFFEAFSKFDCRPSHLSLFNPPTVDLESFLLEKNLIYVGGGNTKSMLALWHAWGLDTILRKAWDNGVVLAGLSAGAICWFEQGVTDSIPGQLGPLDCLGFLPGSCCPHYDGEVERRPAYHRLLEEGKISAGFGIDDGAALHFTDRELLRVMSSRPNAKAYRLEKLAGKVIESPLETKYLRE